MNTIGIENNPARARLRKLLATGLGTAIGTMFLSFGNAFMFGGLFSTPSDQASFDRFQEKLG